MDSKVMGYRYHARNDAPVRNEDIQMSSMHVSGQKDPSQWEILLYPKGYRLGYKLSRHWVSPDENMRWQTRACQPRKRSNSPGNLLLRRYCSRSAPRFGKRVPAQRSIAGGARFWVHLPSLRPRQVIWGGLWKTSQTISRSLFQT